MLHQNWFMDERFEMFEEYYDTQLFYDTETDCFYVVSELDDETVQIVQHEGGENDLIYPQLKCKYEEWKQNQIKEYTVNFFADLDITISATSPEDARKKAEKAFGEYHKQAFQYIYVNEIRSVRDEDGNEV